MFPKIAVTLPTRKRSKVLQQAIKSLIDNVSDVNNIEILIKVDNDDIDTINILNSLPSCCKYTILDVKKFKGYLSLHTYTEKLIELASSSVEWIVTMNDDAIMKTKDWDLKLLKYSGQFLVLNPQTNMNLVIFPIYPKKWVDILGHLSKSNHADTWIEFIAKGLNILRNIDIEIFHDRADLTGNNNDDTYKERVYTTNDIFTIGMQMLMDQDKQKIKSYLEGKVK